jgi:LDH2 family malate/lactate/ureidoglycolate dehydrogenase
LAVGLLSGPVIGAALGRELADALAAGEGERRRGHLFVAIDPGAFGDAGSSARRTADFATYLKGSRRSADSDEIVMPGERSHRAKARHLAGGIPLPTPVWMNTMRIARELGVEPPALDQVGAARS